MDGRKNQSRRLEKVGANGDAMAEDVGKKRGSDQVHGNDQEYHENNDRALEEGVKRKKVPKATSAPAAASSAVVRPPQNDSPPAAGTSELKKAPIATEIRKATSTATQTAANSNANSCSSSTSNPSHQPPELQSPPPVQVWDVESALLYLVASPLSSGDISLPGATGVDPNEEEEEREYLTLPPNFDNATTNNQDTATPPPPSSSSRPWITFRMAHAGDAFLISSWYRRQKAQHDEAKQRRRRADQEDEERHGQNSEHGNVGEEEDDEDDDPELVKRTPIVASHITDRTSENGNQTIPSMRDDCTDLKVETPRRSSSSSSTSSGGSPIDNNSTTPSNTANSNLLEHWLAEGLGDEDHCPSVYGLLAYVHRENSCRNYHVGTAKSTSPSQQQQADDHQNALKKQSHVFSTASTTAAGAATSSTAAKMLSAVVLLTVAWQGGERSLRIEWMAVGGGDGDEYDDDDGGDTDGGVVKLLEPAVVLSVQQKLWLRIAALSVMTACPLIAVDKDVLALMTKCRHENATRASEGNNGAATTRPQKKESTIPSTTRVLPSAE